MKGQRPLDFWLRLVDDLLSKSFGSALEEHGLTRRQWAMVNLLSAGPAGRADLDAVLAPFLPPPELTFASSVKERRVNADLTFPLKSSGSRSTSCSANSMRPSSVSAGKVSRAVGTRSCTR